jgi:hypothetical protein
MEMDMTVKKAATKKTPVEFHRGGKMDDDTFYASMAVDTSMPLWLGVMELLDRAEDGIWDRNRDADLSRDTRADLSIQAGVVRELRSQLVAAREFGLEKVRQK